MEGELIVPGERQLSLDFDYDDTFKPGDVDVLEKMADKALRLNQKGRLMAIENRMELGATLSEAKKSFRQENPDKPFGNWSEQRCRVPRSTANKLLQVHRAFGRQKIETLIGIPPGMLVVLAQDQHEEIRKEVLKLAKKQMLSVREVKQLLAPEKSSEDVSFKASGPPKDRDEAKLKLAEKIGKVLAKCPDDVKDDAPGLLREIAEDLETVPQGEESDA